jgi:CBS domain-containing protein
MTMESFSVSTVMNVDVKKITADQNITGACKIMHDNQIGSVVIVELDDPKLKPVGIITERDIVRILGELKPWLSRLPLRELMSKPVITIESEASLKNAADTMNSHNVRRLIVVDAANNMVGIISEKDIFREMVKNRELVAEFFGERLPAESKKLFEKVADFNLGDPRKL